MTKSEFLSQLDNLLQGMDIKEREKTIKYYDEMIDDYIEDGVSEQEATQSLGDVSIIARDILDDYRSKGSFVPPKNDPNHMVNVLIALLILLGSPVWVPIILTVFILLLTLFFLLFIPLIILGAVLVSVVFALFIIPFTSLDFLSILCLAGLISLTMGLVLLLIPVYKKLLEKISSGTEKLYKKLFKKNKRHIKKKGE